VVAGVRTQRLGERRPLERERGGGGLGGLYSFVGFWPSPAYLILGQAQPAAPPCKGPAAAQNASPHSFGFWPSPYAVYGHGRNGKTETENGMGGQWQWHAMDDGRA
jgi:hypothetical protein